MAYNRDKIITQCDTCEAVKYEDTWIAKGSPMYEQIKYQYSHISHGICEPCADKEFGKLRRKAAERRAQQAKELSDVVEDRREI